MLFLRILFFQMPSWVTLDYIQRLQRGVEGELFDHHVESTLADHVRGQVEVSALVGADDALDCVHAAVCYRVVGHIQGVELRQSAPTSRNLACLHSAVMALIPSLRLLQFTELALPLFSELISSLKYLAFSTVIGSLMSRHLATKVS